MTAIRLLIIAFLIPNEFNFALGSFVLSPYRIALIFLTPYIIWSFYNNTRTIDWNLCDIFALLIGIWPIIAFGLNTGGGAAFESGGIQALELIAPYFLIRLNVRTHRHRVEFSKILFLAVTILVALGLPESITGRHFTHEFASALTGISYSGSAEQRFGVWRAMGPTDHAIIFGTLCAIALPSASVLARYQPKFWLIVMLSIAGAIMSASSAPILAVMVQLGMLVWASVMKSFRSRWWLLLGLFLFFYIVVDVLSNRDPIRVMFTYLLLNPETGYARYYMWINSFEVSAQSAWGLFFGYGYSTEIFDVIDSFYWRNLMKNTVDSFWLVLMLRFGIVTLILFSMFSILAFAKSLRHIFGSNKRHERRFMQAWFITAFAMTLIATTVHFWGYMACVYMMVLAVCVGDEGSRNHTKQRRRSKRAKSMNLARRAPYNQNIDSQPS